MSRGDANLPEIEAGERCRTEKPAQANEAQSRNLAILRAQQEATIDGLLVVDEDRSVSSYNQRFCELWNIPQDFTIRSEEELMLEHMLSCVRHPDLFRRWLNRCYENPQEQGHDEVELNDGRIFDRDTRPVFSDTGQYFGRVWYFRDITERRRAEVQILGLNRELTRAYEAMAQAYDATIEGWSRALDLRDKETEGHSRRVTEITMRMAIVLGLCGEDLIQIRRGALLHDIGKMGIPDHILLKSTELSGEEWAVMRRHPTYAYEMLSPIQFLRPALDIPFCHHEKWDGSGYPRGLAGEDIPLAARLFAVVDVWDALRSDRPYRKAWPQQKLKTHIISLAGTHLDPGLVPIFLSLISEDDALSDHTLFLTIDYHGESDLLDDLARAA
jgi:putative nucleotidyltransferase with HDIG domain